jgi:hypothetical protein
MPHHQREHQILLAWRMIVEIRRLAERAAFPHSQMGRDLLRLFVYSACVGFEINKRPATSAKIAHYLELPYETARRCLSDLVKSGHLKREGSYYFRTRLRYHGIIPEIVKLIKQTADEL